MTNLDRRSFARLAALGLSAAALRVSPLIATPTRRVARLSANENPHGPSPAAIEAITNSLSLSNRYPDPEEERLTEMLARMHGVDPNQIALGNGSSELLKFAALAFTGPRRALVAARPTFEAIAGHARVGGAEVIEIPLTSDYRHDLGKTLAVKAAGLIYICNPNNPTASITPKEELRLFVGGIPSKTIIVVDEAYHHYVESDRYESLIPVVKRRTNLVVLRTFSKIYGMAGLRCGYAVGPAEVIERMKRHQPWNNMNLAALAGATASLSDSGHVERHRRRNTETRQEVVRRLRGLGFESIPSEANFIMVDIHRDVRPVIAALREQDVQVGRFFPALPNHLRVTIGTPDSMEQFLDALQKVTATGLSS